MKGFVKRDILNMDLSELKTFVSSMGESQYRANQIFEWVYKKRVADFSKMTNIPLPFREQLEKVACIGTLKLLREQVSKIDETKKCLFEMKDGDRIESVLMKYKYGYSVCISSQAGCKMGCVFCATAKDGFRRNLTAGEMVGQVFKISCDLSDDSKVKSVVIMGMGEPFDNYDEVIKAVRIMNMSPAFNIGYRHITISTCGLVPGIKRLSKEGIPVTLSISLHAPDDETRTKLMPINRKYNLDDVLMASKEYIARTGRRVTFEYALMKGVNDTPEHAKSLNHLLKGILCHVNLIPVNYIDDDSFIKPSENTTEEFKRIISASKMPVTVRRELGSDINAACGQLRRRSHIATCPRHIIY